MRNYLFVFITIFCTNAISAQVLHKKYYKEAWFTNYHGIEVSPKLQKDFYEPKHVFEHLLASKSLSDFSKIIKEKDLADEEIKRLYRNNLKTLDYFSYNGIKNMDIFLDNIIEFKHDNFHYALIKFHAYNQADLSSFPGTLTVLRTGAKWVIFEVPDFQYQNDFDRDFDLINISLSSFTADGLEKLIVSSDNLKGSDLDIKNYLTSQNGLNLSKTMDLILFYGPSVEGKNIIHDFFKGYRSSRFGGWEDDFYYKPDFFVKRSQKRYLDYFRSW